MKYFFVTDLYIKIHENKFEIKNVTENGRWASAYPDSPYTTDRLLVGTFSAAEPALRGLVKSALPKSWIKKRPRVVMHPVSKVEGGLSEVEERILRELALGSGAIKVALHVGSELTDSEALELIGSV